MTSPNLNPIPTPTGIWIALRQANSAFARHLGASRPPRRQPVHTVYGGGHLFTRETPAKLGRIAREILHRHAPDGAALAAALGVGWTAARAEGVYARLARKLELEPVEEFRIDFEDGYGYRGDEAEDRDATNAAREMAEAALRGELPAYSGIRVKSFSNEGFPRASRTLEVFLAWLGRTLGGRLPANFVVTLPKVVIPEQAAALASLLDLLESKHGIAPGSIEIELMIESPHAIFDVRGASALRALVQGAGPRCRGAHFGVYDYTAACGITSASQGMVSPAADFARNMMNVGLAGTGIMLSDGATQVLPLGPHRAPAGAALTAAQAAENREAVFRGWRLHYANVRHSLASGFYQGWDLHPAQLVPRYAAIYAYFLENLDVATSRLRAFADQAAQTAVVGGNFDDAASGEGLLNFFARGLACGAITEAEALATGLTLAELRGGSFAAVLARGGASVK